MPIDYSFPSWMVPRSEPWQAMVAGVQAGSQIAATRQRGQALGMQLRHQAFQEEASKAKFDSDQADLARLQEWWPSFVSAEGDSLRALQAPPLKNAQMWNRVTMELEKRKQQSAASEFANVISTEDLRQPEGQAKAWKASRGIVPPEQVSAIIGRQVTAGRMENSALETARHNKATEENALLRIEEGLPQEGPITAKQVVDEKGNPIPGWWDIPGKNGTHHTYHESQIKNLPAGVQNSILKSQMSDIRHQLDEELPSERSPRFTPEIGKERARLGELLKSKQAAQEALLHPQGAQASPAAPAQAPTATNPTTGEQIIFKDGKWQPLK